MKILFVDDEDSLRIAVSDELVEQGYNVVCASNGELAIELIKKDSFDLVITDLIMDKISGIDIINFIKDHSLPTEVLLITAHGSIETAIDALKKGAMDYLCKPFEIDTLLHIVRNVKETIKLKRENEQLRVKLHERFLFSNIIGKSAVMQRMFDLLEIVSNSDKTALIIGETGTGKELVAEAILYNGTRKDKPFVSVSCASLSKEVLESELFGHEKGAFTGAIKERKGRFELAHNGTLFLDEVDDIPLDTQVKLLKVIESGKFERVGSEKSQQVDVRIIAAAKNDLYTMVEEGKFRRDLYYRLNVVQIILPPLRDRKEDIPLLVSHFLKKYAPDRTINFSAEIMELLLHYDWDGNVRELEHAVERLILLSKDGQVRKEALPIKVLNYKPQSLKYEYENSNLHDHLFAVERQILLEALTKANGNKAQVADMLKIPLPTLKSKLIKFDLP